MPKQFRPTPWTPPSAPGLEGAFQANRVLAGAELWTTGEGPEDAVVDRDGTAIVGTKDGSLLQVSATRTTILAEVGGRPLGIEWYGDDLLVCNAHLGLQLVSRSGVVRSLVSGFEGRPFIFTNNATVASDGTVYFTDTSTRWPIEEYVSDLLEGQPTGRLFARSPDGALRLVLDRLHFANGVALDPDEASVFVAETGRYRVQRHWLTGELAGQTHVFVDNLPGFPDNLSFGADTLWVPLASPRQRLVDLMHPRPWMRKATFRLPEALKPKPLRHGIVLGYDTEGRLTHNLQDSSGRVAITTSARYADGRLFIGSLTEPHLAVYPIG